MTGSRRSRTGCCAADCVRIQVADRRSDRRRDRAVESRQGAVRGAGRASRRGKIRRSLGGHHGRDSRRQGREERGDRAHRRAQGNIAVGRRQMGSRRAQENDQRFGDVDLRRHCVGDRRNVSRHHVRCAGRLLRQMGRRRLQLVLQCIQLDSVSAPGARRRGGAAAERRLDDHLDSRAHRLDPHVPAPPRGVFKAQGARVRASRRRARRIECATNVHAHLS